ncbi:MAG: cytochrome c oxidase subunit II [Candidatus Kapaibacterium sp.]|nr:cytochrome c oxidase subunit II [Ignavibacteriota bacterium]MCB9220276.1 cytochrome c oxidase subunit II [Ignavibacteria bacterium]
MFEQTSKYVGTVDGAMLYITAFSVLMLLLITVAMIYFVIKYRASKNPIPTQYHGNAVIEVIWIVIPTIIVLSMFYYGYTDFSDLRNTKQFDEEYHVTAKMWDWDFKYDNGVITDTLYVPVGKTLKFNITSIDVLHSFYLPAFRIKEDAVPGRNGFIFITPNKTGVYDIACAEYCGVNHWDMYKKLIVMEQDEYSKWYNSQSPDKN